jgi:hypothetical protein
VIDVDGHRLGEPHRTGEILEVLRSADHEHYRVRWEDGRVTIVYPAGDVVIRHGRGARNENSAAEPRRPDR